MQLFIELKGVPELMKQLNGTERGIVKQMLRRGLRAAAKPILQTAKRLCPYRRGQHWQITGAKLKRIPKKMSTKWGVYEKKLKTGERITELTKRTHLRDLLGIRAMKRRKGRIGIIIGTSSVGFTGRGFYGGFVELGTSKMAARPFLRSAFDSNVEIANNIIKAELDAALTMALAASGRMGEGTEGIMPTLIAGYKEGEE